MGKKELKDYIEKNLKTRSFQQIKWDLLRVGWAEKDVEKAFKDVTHPTGKWKIILIFVFVFFAMAGFYAYFFIISPVFVSKPDIEKPEMSVSASGDLSQQTTIKPEHIIFLLNEMGAYKLHNSITGDKPQISVVLDNQEYFFSVTNNNVVSAASSPNPDIRIDTNKETIIQIYSSDDTKSAILNSYGKGNINVALLADITTLALKGYKSLYDYLGITGASSKRFFFW